MNNLFQHLQQLDREFQSEEVKDFGEVPDGTYSAAVEVARFTESKTEKKPMIEFQFVITGGKFAKRKEWKYHVLEEGRMKFLKFDLIALGVELESLAQLPDILPSLLDKVVEININTKKGDNGKSYRNLYVNKSKQGSSTNSSAPAIKTNDLPF